MITDNVSQSLARPIVILADDLTGAGDTVLPFWHEIKSAKVLPAGLPDEGFVGEDFGFSVTSINMATRHDDATELVRKARHVASILNPDTHSVYLKMDSTLRGHWPEWLGCLVQLWKRPVVVAPAFPDVGRTTINAIHYLHGQPVHETIAGLDPIAPVLQSNIRALAQHAQVPVAHVRLSALQRDGVDAIRAAVMPLLQQPALVTVDAETEADMAVIANALATLGSDVMACGSAGLAERLAPFWAAEGSEQPDPPLVKKPVLSPKAVVVISGSETPLTASQWAEWQGRYPNAKGINTADWPELIPEVWAEHLKQAVLAQMDSLIEQGHVLSGWVVCGGETAAVVMDALDMTTLTVASAMLPTMPLYVARSKRYPEHTFWLVTKSGNFGTPDTLVSLYQGLCSNANACQIQ